MHVERPLLGVLVCWCKSVRKREGTYDRVSVYLLGWVLGCPLVWCISPRDFWQQRRTPVKRSLVRALLGVGAALLPAVSRSWIRPTCLLAKPMGLPLQPPGPIIVAAGCSLGASICSFFFGGGGVSIPDLLPVCVHSCRAE